MDASDQREILERLERLEAEVARLRPAPMRAEAGEAPTRGRLNQAEVARWLGRSVATVERWRRAGIIPFEKTGGVVQFDLGAVDEALRARALACRPMARTRGRAA
jgi:excisionase family DNA binding protein